MIEGFEFQVGNFEPNPLEKKVSLHFKKEEIFRVPLRSSRFWLLLLCQLGELRQATPLLQALNYLSYGLKGEEKIR